MLDCVSINGRAWTVGLRWTPPEKRRFTSRKSLLESGQTLDDGFDVAASRRSRAGTQLGFGSAKDHWPQLVGAPALCACLEVPPDFLGLFCLESALSGERFWWVHLRMGGVMADYGDQIFPGEEDARAFVALMEQVAGISAETRESPMQSALWLGEHCTYSPLDRWILARGHLLHFSQVASRHTVRGLTAIAAALLLCIGAGLGWSRHAETSAMEKARAQRAANLQRKADLERHPERFFDMPWHKAALATDFAGACLPPMMRLPLASNGWQLQSAVCDGKKVAVEWSHAGGADFTRLPEGAHLDEKDMRMARSSLALGQVPVTRPDGEGTDHSLLLTRGEALGLLAEITQSTGTKLSAPTFRPAKTRTVDKVTIQAPWRDGTWELSGVPDLLLEAAPGEDGISLFTMLSEIPGLGLESITFRDGWHIRGSIHARQ